LGAGIQAAAGEPLSAAGTISKVTVYRGQALVTRKIDVDAPTGASELVVPGLPANILPESIYAQSSADVKILSVRYRQHAVMEDTRDEVRQLDSQIEGVKHDLKVATEQSEHLNVQWKMFESLRDFTVTAEKSDLNRGLLTFEPIDNLTGLIEKKGIEYLGKRLELEDKLADLQGKLALLERQHKDLMAGQSKTEREAAVFMSGAGKHISLELSYLVGGAGWQQQYNLRANPDRSTVVIEYNAVVNQTSGEDWNGVTLSLSTAEPTMVAAAPVLDPMLVGLAGRGQVLMPPTEQPGRQPAAQVPQAANASPAEQVRQMQQQRKVNIGKGIAANSELNELAASNQAFVFNFSQKEIQRFQQQAAEMARVEGVSVTYDLAGRLTLPSRSDQQLVTIATIAAKAEFTLVASPLLTDYVYLQADMVNGSDTILLPGPASIFRDGQFVGRGNVPLVTIGERFTGGFGIDSQVQVAHELEEKTTRVQGGNRIDTYTYRIALRNYKNAAVGLRLLDRLPYTEDASIRIELGKTEPSLSTDAEYLRTLGKKGILRWDLKLGPNTVDDKATIVRYSYTMEYDRNMQIQPRRSSGQ
jgi:archaellum component FlaC